MDGTLRVTPELIAQYLDARQADGLSATSLAGYRRKLQQLYDLLPEGKELGPGTLSTLADQLEKDGYSPRTLNVFLSAADGLLAFCGRFDLQARARRETAESIQPELTRAEYLRLLSTAKLLGRKKAYFLIKCFATLGINTNELPLVTVEAARKGYFRAGKEMVRIPASFAWELLGYAREEWISRGPIFVSRNGKPPCRSNLNAIIASVQQDARVAPEKCNPSCLRKLCQATQAMLQARVQVLLDQEYERILAQENITAGWEEAPADAPFSFAAAPASAAMK